VDPQQERTGLSIDDIGSLNKKSDCCQLSVSPASVVRNAGRFKTVLGVIQY